MTIKAAIEQLSTRLLEHYDERESKQIAQWLLEDITGMDRVRLKMEEQTILDWEALERFETASIELIYVRRPVQYVLGWAPFLDMKLRVTDGVLIPRPETEELAVRVQDYLRRTTVKKPTVLDLGTGSGCLALASKKEHRKADVCAVDVSEVALAIAEKNASELDLYIKFWKIDILDREQWIYMAGEWDVIVSNPPYITEMEKQNMSPVVLQHEPEGALFVPNDDPLLFYRAIAEFAWQALSEVGVLFFELNARYAYETATMVQKIGFSDVLVHNDLQGKPRMLEARRSADIEIGY